MSIFGRGRGRLSIALILGGALAMAAPTAARSNGSNALLEYYYIDQDSFEVVAVTADTCTDRGVERAPVLNIPGTTVVTQLYGYC